MFFAYQNSRVLRILQISPGRLAWLSGKRKSIGKLRKNVDDTVRKAGNLRDLRVNSNIAR